MHRIVDKPIVSVAGLRGIVGETFTPEVIFPYVAAFAALVKTPKVVVGGDSRPSRAWAQPLVESILRARGIEVVSVGLVPTPTLGMMVRHHGAGGGIAITASHNPTPWNGLKFFHEAGEFLTPAHHHEMEALMTGAHAMPAVTRLGAREARTDAIDLHLAHLLRVLPPLASPTRRVKVVLDCCNGAASYLAPRVAEAYGAEAIVLFNDPAQPFPRVAEPLPEHLGALCEAVRKHGADFGAAIDPDADRLALVDDTGRAIGEERTLVLGADCYLERTGSTKPLVVNLSTSQAIDRVAERRGLTVGRTRIGEAHVLAGLRAHGSDIGGEGNGGVILPAVHPGRDAATALALVLLGLQSGKPSLSAWNASYPDYVMIKDKVELGSVSVADTLERARCAFDARAALDATDGLKIVFADRWLHIRPSGTEPILRLFVEAPDHASAQSLLDEARALLS